MTINIKNNFKKGNEMKKTGLTILFLSMMFGFQANAWSAEHVVKMLNNGTDGIMVFEPGYLKVEKGDTVKFAAIDLGHDTISTYVPEGGTAWKGSNSKDTIVTLDAEGVYVYKCTPHSVMGMVGVIQVGKVKDKTAAEKAAVALNNTVAMNKERLIKYMAEIK